MSQDLRRVSRDSRIIDLGTRKKRDEFRNKVQTIHGCSHGTRRSSPRAGGRRRIWESVNSGEGASAERVAAPICIYAR